MSEIVGAVAIGAAIDEKRIKKKGTKKKTNSVWKGKNLVMNGGECGEERQ